jgi:BirA family biotin operon repressor/biotin-[acetyl-CoA-carboxylase] ligase
VSRLDVEQIRSALGETILARLDALDVFEEIDSTNDWLLGKPMPASGRLRAALAEYQSAGRGRRGRRWISPRSSGICLSLAYTFNDNSRDIGSVTLAAGVGIAERLETFGVEGIGLKWPNDLVIRDAKLGGILTESRLKPGGALSIVIGVGINVELPDVDALTSDIGRVMDLASCLESVPPRSRLAAGIIDSLCATLEHYDATGFDRFFEAWPRYDWLHGQRVCIDEPDEHGPGVCQGIDEDGALIVQNGTERRRLVSGSVRLYGQSGHSLR